MTERLELILCRMAECTALPAWDDLPRNLLHAYAACLNHSEVCRAAVLTLDATAEVRRAVRNRLMWLGREGAAPSELDTLGRELLAQIPGDARQRERIDTLLSHLYTHLGSATREAVLERWRDRGTAGALARWLKAVGEDDELYDTTLALEAWRRTGRPRAAWLLARRAEPERLTDILPELVDRVSEGWILSRAVLRSATVAEEVWASLRADFPATYAYLCAKTGRDCTEAEALALVLESDGGVMGDRGLAIWAVGQMGMIGVLEQIREDHEATFSS